MATASYVAVNDDSARFRQYVDEKFVFEEEVGDAGVQPILSSILSPNVDSADCANCEKG